MKKKNLIRIAVFVTLYIIGVISSAGIKFFRAQRFYNLQFNGVVNGYKLGPRTNFVYINFRGEESYLCLYGYLDNKTYSISAGDSIFKYPKSVNIYLKRDGKVTDVSAPKNRELVIIGCE